MDVYPGEPSHPKRLIFADPPPQATAFPIMQRTDFDQSLQAQDQPPAALSRPATALWWVCKRNWEKAHNLIDSAPGSDEAWVHAFLHRMEGDQANADYWYRRAGRERPNITIGKELEQLLRHFVN